MAGRHDKERAGVAWCRRFCLKGWLVPMCLVMVIRRTMTGIHEWAFMSGSSWSCFVTKREFACISVSFPSDWFDTFHLVSLYLSDVNAVSSCVFILHLRILRILDDDKFWQLLAWAFYVTSRQYYW